MSGWLLLAMMLFHIVALAVTGGPVTGPVSLRKPAAFAETTWLMSWSVALILPMVNLAGWRRHLVGVAVLAFGFGETTIMAVQAWRGVPSHYNFTTVFDSILMSGGAAGLSGVLLVGMLVLLASTRRVGMAPHSVRLGIRAGVGVLLVGCVVGFIMISNMSGVFQGSVGSSFTRLQNGYMGPSPAAVGQEYLLLHPFTDGGDLVLLHAIGVHGLVLLTLPALLLAQTRLAESTRLRYVRILTLTVVAGLFTLGVNAFAQRPWAELGTLQSSLLAAFALGYVAALTACGLAWIRHRGSSPHDPRTTVGDHADSPPPSTAEDGWRALERRRVRF